MVSKKINEIRYLGVSLQVEQSEISFKNKDLHGGSKVMPQDLARARVARKPGLADPTIPGYRLTTRNFAERLGMVRHNLGYGPLACRAAGPLESWVSAAVATKPGRIVGGRVEPRPPWPASPGLGREIIEGAYDQP